MLARIAGALPVLGLSLLGFFAGCSDRGADQEGESSSASARERDDGEPSATANGEGGSSGRGAPASVAPLPTPSFERLSQRCKLISDRHLDDPTANNTHFRANLRGTDLGIPVAHGADLFFFFGDTAGTRAIWSLGPESLPDAVGFVSHAEARNDPSSLCSKMRFLTTAGSGAGHAADDRIERDWAAGSMIAPPGHSLAEFIRNPAGKRGVNAFPHLPGDFEVPSGAFSHDGAIWMFYTTVVSPSQVEMKGSYLVKWTAPSTTALPTYQILYHVDQRFDATGQLRGDFINIAPMIVGDWVYLYGSGEYRKSSVHLARKRLADLATEGGFERFDSATKTWRAANDPSCKPVAVSPAVGELSVQYFPSLGRFVMMNQEINANGNQIVARFASAPEGPWSEPIAMGNMSDPAFRSEYCCVNGVCEGKRLFNCDRAGFYATYMLPDARVNGDGSFTIDFTMSTWDPYNVALMSATFQ